MPATRQPFRRRLAGRFIRPQGRARTVRSALPPILHGRVYGDFGTPDAYFTSALELMLSLYDVPRALAGELRESLRGEPRPFSAWLNDYDEAMKRRRNLVRQVMIYPGEDGYWVAECPSLPGCISQGTTRQEAIANVRDAIQEYVVALEDDNLPVPADRFETIVVAV